MTKPVVGIVGADHVVLRFWGELPVTGSPTSYVDAVLEAGGLPVVVPGRADARPWSGRPGLPVLGVCRGLQLLAVAFGGRLTGVLGDDRPVLARHRQGCGRRRRGLRVGGTPTLAGAGRAVAPRA